MQQLVPQSRGFGADAESLRPLTLADLELTKALNYASLCALSAGRFDDTENIVDGTIQTFGRLMPALICRYASNVLSQRLDAIQADAELEETFRPAELDTPLVRLMRLSLIVMQQSKLPGFEEKVEQARRALLMTAEDDRLEPAIRQRALEILDMAAAQAQS